MPDWSAAHEEAVASAPADVFRIETLELIHPAFVDDEEEADSIRIALDEYAWSLEMEDDAPLFAGETKLFEPLAMEVEQPAQEEGGLGHLTIAVDNVPRTVFRQIQAAAEIRATATLIYRVWLATRDPETGEYAASGPPDFKVDQLSVRVVSATRLRLEATATFVDLLNKLFPRMRFDRDNFAGLFGGA